MRQKLRSLLDRLLVTHSPGGLEQEMDQIITDVLMPLGKDIHRDPHGNVYVIFEGRHEGPLTVVSAHKDELSTVVRKIDDDGKIWLDPIGGTRPAKYGEGPFDLVTAGGVIEGVLCIGSTHSSELSPRVNDAKNKALTWDMVYLDCKLDGDEMRERGVIVGDRAVVGRSRKTPMYLQDGFIAGYALDDKAAVAVLLLVAEALNETPPTHDTCLGFTATEEGGVSGAAYLARHLDPDDFIAIEVGPVAEEYPIEMSDSPVLLFKDGSYHYSTDLTRALLDAGERCDTACQTAVIRCFGSDASVTASAGLVGRPACICFPTENTHGYEITRLKALENCVSVLREHLTT
ncbi:MAG: M20/M25/M40 family metallo-hydrolase [Armatimonadota bacterium]